MHLGPVHFRTKTCSKTVFFTACEKITVITSFSSCSLYHESRSNYLESTINIGAVTV